MFKLSLSFGGFVFIIRDQNRAFRPRRLELHILIPISLFFKLFCLAYFVALFLFVCSHIHSDFNTVKLDSEIQLSQSRSPTQDSCWLPAYWIHVLTESSMTHTHTHTHTHKISPPKESSKTSAVTNFHHYTS